jgi:hypothetical protein
MASTARIPTKQAKQEARLEASRNFEIINARRTKRDLHENSFGEWRDDAWS